MRTFHGDDPFQAPSVGVNGIAGSGHRPKIACVRSGVGIITFQLTNVHGRNRYDTVRKLKIEEA